MWRPADHDNAEPAQRSPKHRSLPIRTPARSVAASDAGTVRAHATGGPSPSSTVLDADGSNSNGRCSRRANRASLARAPSASATPLPTEARPVRSVREVTQINSRGAHVTNRSCAQRSRVIRASAGLPDVLRRDHVPRRHPSDGCRRAHTVRDAVRAVAQLRVEASARFRGDASAARYGAIERISLRWRRAPRRRLAAVAAPRFAVVRDAGARWRVRSDARRRSRRMP